MRACLAVDDSNKDEEVTRSHIFVHGFCWTIATNLNFQSPSTIPILHHTKDEPTSDIAARQVEAAPPISKVSTFTRTIPRKFDVVFTDKSVPTTLSTVSNLAHNVPPHVVVCNGKKCPQEDPRHHRTLSVEPSPLHSGVTSSLRHHNT